MRLAAGSDSRRAANLPMKNDPKALTGAHEFVHELATRPWRQHELSTQDVWGVTHAAWGI